MAFFFQIEALLSLKNAWLPQISFFGFLDTKSTCQVLLSPPHSFKLRKKYPCISRLTQKIESTFGLGGNSRNGIEVVVLFQVVSDCNP